VASLGVHCAVGFNEAQVPPWEGRVASPEVRLGARDRDGLACCVFVANEVLTLQVNGRLNVSTVRALAVTCVGLVFHFAVLGQVSSD